MFCGWEGHEPPLLLVHVSEVLPEGEFGAIIAENLWHMVGVDITERTKPESPVRKHPLQSGREPSFEFRLIVDQETRIGTEIREEPDLETGGHTEHMEIRRFFMVHMREAPLRMVRADPRVK